MQTRDFSLEPALSYKRRMEEIRQFELARLETSYLDELRTLGILRDVERSGLAELTGQHTNGRLNVSAIGVTFGELQAVRKQIERQECLVESLAERVSVKRMELIELAKEKKALEKLKEKHEFAIAKALAKEQDKALEETASNRYLSRRKVDGWAAG